MRPLLLCLAALTATLAPVTGAAAPDATTDVIRPNLVAGPGLVTAAGRITLDDSTAGTGSTRIRQRSGLAELAPVRFASVTPAVLVGYSATEPKGTTAEVDVRALHAGRWTEWTTTSAGRITALPAAGHTIQLRVVLSAPATGAKPSLGDLTVQPAAGTARSITIQAAPLVSRVFATREGLVGGTTANGHVIISRDHFVALPSRRGLSANNGGTYSVKVCGNGRCAFEPVWDVGPWNTRDDYWNPSSVREMWKDLPQGRPEAQAAYQNGYNGGLDQFGRRVANPAGIDLADGTFWDGLRLADNSWVDVTYLWTGTGGRGTVSISSGYLNVRNAGSTSGAVVGMAGRAAQVPVECQITGQSVSGSQGTSNIWLRVHPGMYVAKAWISTGSHPAC